MLESAVDLNIFWACAAKISSDLQQRIARKIQLILIFTENEQLNAADFVLWFAEKILMIWLFAVNVQFKCS